MLQIMQFFNAIMKLYYRLLISRIQFLFSNDPSVGNETAYFAWKTTNKLNINVIKTTNICVIKMGRKIPYYFPYLFAIM